MVEYNSETALSDLLKAVSDNTRRSLLTRICQEGPCRVTDLARFYDISLNGISKHLKVLERSGLIQRKTVGREHWIEADLSKTESMQQWFTELQSIWLQRLEQLENLLGEKQ
jgi:predicted transcriptional regulator